MKRFELIDFLKGYSISATVLFHYSKHLQLSNPFEKVMFFGGTGVHIFIVLSGFGLYYSEIKRPLTYKRFIKKRISKIYLPYIFVILLSAFISLFIPAFQNSLYALGGHVFLYKMFDESIIGSYGYPTWFISMMLQFYFAFHIIIWFKSKLRNKPFLVLSILISLSWTIFVVLMHKETERIWNSFFLQYLWEFSLGMAIADKASKDEKIITKGVKQSLLLTIGIASAVLCGVLTLKAGEPGKMFNDFFALTATAFFAVFVFNLKIKPLNKILLFVGKLSTPIYLLHILVILVITNLCSNLDPIYRVLLAVISIVPIAIVYQKMIKAYFKFSKL
ncbi:MAG: Peptidoglycan/LPS O-acetylase OafA/YrhL [uncultured Aureispira sp.]|uniref:Peptidoglycan/LPS O-acetylase OafA/YrhL n=1 Tax=uncultured Aureispira sp. TaxID=1331704 RepID=A0A6S6S3X7_9BACT|nr:MAG: Peptidoglycan/LPS O-acetylase OafA/YrhL [uncultured Aureispira sp.]